MRSVNLDFLRFVQMTRTSSSELFLLWSRSTRVGYLSIHYSQRYGYAILIVECRNDKGFIQKLVERVYDFLGNPEPDRDGNEFLISAFTGTEAGFWSGTYDHSDQPATSAELNDIKKQLARYTGRHDNALGHLNESIAKEYFEKRGYEVRGATPGEDASKIDLVAVKGGKKLFVQVKSGEISLKIIFECVKSIKLHHDVKQDEMIAIIARSFPEGIEFRRQEIDTIAGCKTLLIAHSDIARAMPKFRQVLD